MKTLKLGKMFRTIEVDRAAANAEARTVELSFSSEEPYERWFGVEILDHGSKSVRLGRLKSGGALLVDHNTRDHVGVVESVSISDRRGTASVRFGKSARAEEIFQDVLDGIRKFTSVGYWAHKMVLEEESDSGPDVYRVTDWEPLEISIVAVPADASVGIGRDAGEETHEVEVEIPEKEIRTMFCTYCGKPADECKGQCEGAKRAAAPPPTDTPPDVRGIENRAIEAERQRVRAIREIGEAYPRMSDFCAKGIAEGKPLDVFRKELIEEELRMRKNEPTYTRIVPPSDRQRFSMSRLILSLAEKESSYEREVCAEYAKRSGMPYSGAPIPPGALTRAAITDTTEGADLTPTQELRDFIDALRSSTPMMALATILDGLVGDVFLPRQNGIGAAGFNTETGNLVESVPTFDNLSIAPKRIGAYTDFGRQLLRQSNPSIDNLVINDLYQAVTKKMNQVAIRGAGANEPTGITETAGVGSVTNGNVALEWSNVIDLEREVDIDNALDGRRAYLTNPYVVAQAKKVAVDPGSGQWIWDRQSPASPLNGYPVISTTCVDSNYGAGLNRSALIFGNFNDLLICLWGVPELIVDPYTLALASNIRVTVHHYMNVGLRHVESFAVCKDIDHAA